MVAYAALQKQDKKALHPYSLRLKHFSQHVRRLWNKPPCFRQYSEETAWTAPQDKVAAAATVWWRPSLIDWKNKIFCDFEKDYPSLKCSPKWLLMISTILMQNPSENKMDASRKIQGSIHDEKLMIQFWTGVRKTGDRSFILQQQWPQSRASFPHWICPPASCFLPADPPENTAGRLH